ncbi:uncharacterized protein N7459_004030 [Penicillium hispanicum]|uniref:uncharacterized protein n=1 Tax=Penicillium hispanicum TaxID=1080232 RepID=UPI0025411635|nr:uncharacterized protein N7459_004030 [Penicillium hispanicum]KAJ5584230.1 hypothetical protein N7459_004030 [Penicillium hispanicum]
MLATRKSRSLTTSVFLLFVAYLFLVWLPLSRLHASQLTHPRPNPIQSNIADKKTAIHLNAATERYPVASYIPLPTKPSPIPRIQYDFPAESRRDRKERVKRQHAVKEAFLHAWNGYKDHAWLRDEVSPKTGGYADSFSGWGATLVDSLDTLVIMGLDEELDLALGALDRIDFTTTMDNQVNVFEIIIRYMGGFLAAHDLTNGKYPILLKKAEELGEMIFNAFDTHNRMPQMRWDWTKSAQRQEILPSERTSLAEMGSLTVEFTRLSQISQDPKYFDAVQRITDTLEQNQNETRIPGLWPMFVDADGLNFDSAEFTLGGGADSTYEYLPKEHILLGAQTDQYQKMYGQAIESIKDNLLFRAMTKDEDQTLLFTSEARIMNGGARRFMNHVQDHLKCFLGGTVALAAKIFDRPEDLSTARGLTDGCIWAYDQMPTGIMPEAFKFIACENADDCPWDESVWYEEVWGQPLNSHEHLARVREVIDHEGLPPGMIALKDPSYKLRPEAVESVFIMYRITGDKSLQDAAWRMFQNIDKVTRTKYGHSAIEDVRNPLPRLSDKMESFWLAETLKYLYLIFSEPDHVSLDEYVLSTEAHPFKRPSGYKS